MAPGAQLGELEYLIMLAVLRLEGEGSAVQIRELLKKKADRTVSRGTLYATLDRLVRKSYVTFATDDVIPERGGVASRRFALTSAGRKAVVRSSRAISRLSEGLTLP
jgi:DNA-binding PadR family transcriptional regulator